MKFNGLQLLILIIFIACNGKENQTKEGLAIAKKKCASCHQFTEAGVLDKGTWLRNILPEMLPRAGLTMEESAKVTEYYSLMAPDSLTRPSPPEKMIRDNWIFEPVVPIQKSVPTSTTTMVAVDSVTGMIYTGDMLKASLYRWNTYLQPIDTTIFSSGISNVIFLNENKDNRQLAFTLLGNMMPSESLEGSLLLYDLKKEKPELSDTVASALPRAVSGAAADFNNDGLMDYLSCGFGHEKGGLYISWQQKRNSYKSAVLIPTAGATQIHVEDFNNDGWKDFMVLFSNSEESVRLFINDQHGAFTMKTLLNFLPVAGSTSFQVTDFNNDGLPDILYTSGDNSDFSKIFKPFHGLYIYINKGDFTYKKEYFFPINGCTKALALDFDNDGDLDIATIAFFADFNNNSGEKCIVFEQDKPMHFIPHSPNIDLFGRWISMATGDYDHDGDQDIVLGNFSWGFLNTPLLNNKWDKRIPFIVLKNKLK